MVWGFVPIYGAVRRPTRFYIAPAGQAVARFSSALVMCHYLALGLPPKYRPTRLFMHAFMRLWHGVVSHPHVIVTRIYRTHRVFLLVVFSSSRSVWGGLYVAVRGFSCYALRLGVRLSVSHVAYLHIYIHKCTKGREYLRPRLSEPLQWIKKAGAELLRFFNRYFGLDDRRLRGLTAWLSPGFGICEAWWLR